VSGWPRLFPCRGAVSTGMDKKTISRDGTSLAYQRTGDGPVVILVSGAMSTGATVAPLAGPLSGRFSVISYDRRGRGESGDTKPYAVAREVEDLAALIDAAGGQASLYGISSGGALVLEAAASGLPVRRAAVYEVPFAVYEGGVQERAEYTAHLTEALEQGRRGDAVELFLRLTGLAEEMIQNARNSPMWTGMESIAPSLAYDDAVMGGGQVPRERLAAIGVPLLSVAGGASPAWLREAAREVAETAPQGTYRSLEGQTHMVDPNVLAPVLAEFFS
jgi:pimeloyl-ACP methyl ester carboxylesterase